MILIYTIEHLFCTYDISQNIICTLFSYSICNNTQRSNVCVTIKPKNRTHYARPVDIVYKLQNILSVVINNK